MLLKANPTSGSISPSAGIAALHSHALGTNSLVVISNANLIGNSGAIFRLGDNVHVPPTVALNVFLPADGEAGPGQYRATFGGLGTAATNTWNGPITVHGADPSSGIATLFILRGDANNRMTITATSPWRTAMPH